VILAASILAHSPGAAVAIELSISPVANGLSIAPETRLVNRSGETWNVTRLSYLLSEPAVQATDGSWQAIDSDPAWMSLAERRFLWRIDPVPEGDWTAIRFSVGLPPSLNDRDPAAWAPGHPLNPNLNGLHWSWQGGYIFLALEGRFWKKGEDDTRAPGFAYHLAREPFRTTVSVPLSFRTRSGGKDRVAIEFDLNRIIDGEKPLSFMRDGSSTHSKEGDPLAAALHENLKSAFRAAASHDGAKQTKTSPPTASMKSAVGSGLPLPVTFPRPKLPEDLITSPERISLGKRLFHETALSKSGTLSCASCHLAAHGLSDPRPLSRGEQGRTGRRNAMPLFNLAWKSAYFWDGRASSLREQVIAPIEDHRELDETIGNVVGKLQTLPRYGTGFADAFGDSGITGDRIALALEAFLISLVSHDSKFDRSRRGEESLTDLEQRGFELFMTEREPRSGQLGGDCFHCHGGPLFTDHQFRNNGLVIDEADPGRGAVTGSALDLGTFSTPSLRNIALTAPYMHDGRFATLEEVLDHYSEGVSRTKTLDPNLAKHPDGGLGLTPDEKSALIAFLRTLTDDQFAQDAYAGDE
jgi:cytochrome c peroxidase